MRFTKAHAYGNDFLYVRADAVRGAALDALARELCDRHTGIGADGLILYDPTPQGATMRLFNADGSHSEVSGNGVRGLGALLLREHHPGASVLTIQTDAGSKELTRAGESDGRPVFRAAMGRPTEIRQLAIAAGGESLDVSVLNMGNPQCVLLGALPGEERFRRLGSALEHHGAFPEGTNVEFAQVDAPDRVRILIWERGVGPTSSSGTGSCAALVAAASYGGAARAANVIAPGGVQRVDWGEDGVHLTGWAEVVCAGEWLRPRR
ncbi:MAG TPA: diaminopimelate epimerase [Vicinamibacterales bacterium]|nr:diaminopimelate epimerase [Vicinamibacterales bacterium]